MPNGDIFICTYWSLLKSFSGSPQRVLAVCHFYLLFYFSPNSSDNCTFYLLIACYILPPRLALASGSPYLKISLSSLWNRQLSMLSRNIFCFLSRNAALHLLNSFLDSLLQKVCIHHDSSSYTNVLAMWKYNRLNFLFSFNGLSF